MTFVRSLRQRKVRDAERAFVVEGFRAIADGIAAGFQPRLVLIRETDADAASEWLGESSVSRLVAAAPFDHIAETITPQGALAVFPFPDLEIPAMTRPFYLIADQIRDPGNLGTLLRSAAAAGVTAVMLTEGSVDPFNGKVVRAAVGAHFRVPIRWFSESLAERLVEECPLRVVADAGGETTYDELNWTAGAMLVIGSEAFGPSDSTRTITTSTTRIPLAAGVESLNAAAAGAVILFEAARQRRHKTPRS